MNNIGKKGILKAALLMLGCQCPGTGSGFIKLYFGEIVMKASWVGIAAATAALMFAGHASAADVEAGKLAFSKSVCKGCHALDYEGYGPAFQDVGRKYAGVATAKEDLTKKVINGTKGAWGDNAMPPQKGALSDENLSAILDMILSFK